MAGVTSLTFALRNTGKAMDFNGMSHGSPEGVRGGAATAQFINFADWARNMEGAGKFKDYAQSLFDNVDKVAKETLGVSNAGTKLARVASKAVNPILCAASGVRVLKDKNKDKALTEEVCAMGAMFGAERIARMARGMADKAIKQGSLEGIINNPAMKKHGETLIGKIKEMPKGGKTALFIAAELLFVGISIAAFDNGKKFGKFLTGRNEDKKVDYKS